MSVQEHYSIIDDPPYEALAREVPVPSSVKGIWISVLGTFFIVLLANWAARAYLAEYTTNRGYWLVGKKWQMLKTMATPVDWLIVGDSSGNQGVVPEKWTDQVGGTAVNLCTVANLTLLDDIWMIERYIERFGPPENVLIVHVYDMWSRELAPAFVAKVPLFWKHVYGSLSALMNTKELSRLFLLRYVPLYSENTTLSKIVLDGIFSPSRLFKREFRLAPGGYMKRMDARPQWVDYDASGHVKFVSENEFVLSKANSLAMRQLVVLAEGYETNIYITNSPIYEGLYASEPFQAYLSQVRQELESFAAQSEHIHYLPGVSVFAGDQMENVDHVIYDAAVRYTEDVARAVMESR